jgi:tripartite-type tricarboxylate transporter receptor subunit TctC
MKSTGRIKMIAFFFFLTPFLVFPATLWGDYPEKPITFIMPWPAGGGTDISLRPLVQAASRNLNQQIPIEYHPGGGTAVGLGLLKNKKPDGYAIGMASINGLINQHTRKVPYDFLKDFTFIMQYAEYTYGLTVLADSPWKTLKEFLEYAKANPGKIRFSSAGPDSPQAMVMALLANQNHIQWTHIPFEGGPPALTALMGKHVEAYTATMQPKPHIQAGRLRLLCTYGEKRLPTFPDVPTLKELGFDIVAPSFMVILAPKGLAAEKTEKLQQAFKMAMEDPNFLKACSMVDHMPLYRNSPDTMKQMQYFNKMVGRILSQMKSPKK